MDNEIKNEQLMPQKTNDYSSLAVISFGLTILVTLFAFVIGLVTFGTWVEGWDSYDHSNIDRSLIIIGTAVSSLSIVGLLIFNLTALKDCKRTARRGKALALMSLIMTSLILAALVTTIILGLIKIGAGDDSALYLD